MKSLFGVRDIHPDFHGIVYRQKTSGRHLEKALFCSTQAHRDFLVHHGLEKAFVSSFLSFFSLQIQYFQLQ